LSHTHTHCTTHTHPSYAAGGTSLPHLFALLGLHMDEVTMPWSSMREEPCRRLFDGLHQVAAGELGSHEAFPLRDDMFYSSFTRVVDMESEVSAADVCNALNGLLCAGRSAASQLDPVRDTLGAAAPAGGAGAPQGVVGAGATLLTTWAERSWKTAFLDAFECLTKRGYVVNDFMAQCMARMLRTATHHPHPHTLPCSTSDEFMRGIKCYQFMRKAMLRLANALVRGNHVTTGHLTVQVSVDDDMNDSERAVFTQTIAAAALGRFLIKVFRDSLGRWRTKAGFFLARPVILSVAHPHAATGRRWVTILGLPVTESSDDAAASNFLVAFQEAAGHAGAEFLFDSFDSATLLMDAEHRARFLEILDRPDTVVPGAAAAAAAEAATR